MTEIIIYISVCFGNYVALYAVALLAAIVCPLPFVGQETGASPIPGNHKIVIFVY